MRVHAPLEQTKLVISDIVKELEQKFPDLNISGADWQKLVEDLRTESRESEFDFEARGLRPAEVCPSVTCPDSQPYDQVETFR